VKKGLVFSPFTHAGLSLAGGGLSAALAVGSWFFGHIVAEGRNTWWVMVLLQAELYKQRHY
jgi:hypothetical protein